MYVEANEPFRLKLSLQFCTCIMSNPSNPVYDVIFNSYCTAPFERKQSAIKQFGLRMELHLQKIELDKSKAVQQIRPKKTPWKTVSLCLCQFQKSVVDPVLYRIYFKELCDTLTDCVPIYTDGSKEGDNVAFAIIVTPFSTFSKRLLDKASIFTAEMSAILTALKYIKGRKNDNKFVIYSD